jgi:hypothetical protein
MTNGGSCRISKLLEGSVGKKTHSLLSLKHMVNTHESQYNRYGHALNTHDLLKIIGIILMIIDHVGERFFPHNLWFRLLGRGAAPLFFFLVGYVNKLNISISLILYGVILSITGYFLNGHLWINILLNFILIQQILSFFQPERFNHFWRMVFFIAVMFLTCFTFTFLEYGLWGLLIAFSARLLAQKDPQGQYYLIGALFFYYLWESVIFGFISSETYCIVFAMLTLGLFYGLRSYRLRLIPCPSWLLPIGLVLSRYSLAIYFYHLIALQLYTLYLHPTPTLQSFWFIVK